MQGKLFNFTVPVMVILTALTGFLIFLPLIPIAALFIKLTWNMVAECLHSVHTITYLQGLKLCFYLYVLRGLLGIKINVS